MSVTYEQWKAQVDKELKGADFEKVLVTRTDGLTIQPLYLSASPGVSAERTGVRGTTAVSTLSFHLQGADAVDEVAIALSLVAQQPSLASLTVTTSVGRDTFIELCKLRALRLCLTKLQLAAEVRPSVFITAQCSERTLTQRDPWVNMLRTTTQVFAAMLGGADEILPTTFDQDLGASALGERVATNTLRILAEESGLLRVADPAAGSYYLDTLTDQVARAAWKRFQEWEAKGGFPAIEGTLKTELEAKWKGRLELVAKRKLPILGVSEFANVDEKLPGAAHLPTAHRDAEQFEALRLAADALEPEALLLTLGTLAEPRARAGFTMNYLAAGGIRSREVSTAEQATLVVICGTDERYATEAAGAATSLKAAGVKRVLLAGRPGEHEATWRAAGVDGFLFLGSDVVATLTDLLELYR